MPDTAAWLAPPLHSRQTRTSPSLSCRKRTALSRPLASTRFSRQPCLRSLSSSPRDSKLLRAAWRMALKSAELSCAGPGLSVQHAAHASALALQGSDRLASRSCLRWPVPQAHGEAPWNARVRLGCGHTELVEPRPAYPQECARPAAPPANGIPQYSQLVQCRRSRSRSPQRAFRHSCTPPPSGLRKCHTGKARPQLPNASAN
mmetsp:Transcript_8129/g.30000  ORF Transcript_8129/g.30000 Transcript_8129/m.30000 type:complete len:203 (+) Transcript_8129:1621-2229(+)